MDKRLAVVTSVVGNYDHFKEPQGAHEKVDFYCFTETPPPPSEKLSRWKFITRPYYGERPFEPNVLNSPFDGRTKVRNMMRAKFYKMQAFHLDILQPYDYIMWIDGSFSMNDRDLPALVHKFLLQHDFACFTHSARSSIEAEALFVGDNRNPYLRERYGDQNLFSQCVRYMNDGMNIAKSGLYEMGNFVYRKDSSIVRELLNLWWRENQISTFQDQISFSYCLWKTSLAPKIISANIYDGTFGTHHSHLPSTEPEPVLKSAPHDAVFSFSGLGTLWLSTDQGRSGSRFLKMEKLFGVAEFYKWRTALEEQGLTLTEIYEKLEKEHVCSAETSRRMQTYELFSELASTVINRDVLPLFRSSDIVVMDTVWDESQIRRLCHFLNLQPTKLFVSPRGKQTGDIWPSVQSWLRGKTLVQHLDPDEWVSTNLTRVTMYESFHPTTHEISLPLEVRHLVRNARLSNPHPTFSDEREVWNLFSQIWLPRLLETSHRVREKVKEGGRVCFVGNETFLLHRIFQHLFPGIPSTYVFFHPEMQSTQALLWYYQAQIQYPCITVAYNSNVQTFLASHHGFESSNHVQVVDMHSETMFQAPHAPFFGVRVVENNPANRFETLFRAPENTRPLSQVCWSAVAHQLPFIGQMDRSPFELSAPVLTDTDWKMLTLLHTEQQKQTCDGDTGAVHTLDAERDLNLSPTLHEFTVETRAAVAVITNPSADLWLWLLPTILGVVALLVLGVNYFFVWKARRLAQKKAKKGFYQKAT